MTQISELKEEIANLRRQYIDCGRGEGPGIWKNIGAKKDQLLDLEREEIIHPFDSEPRLVAALNSIKLAINMLKEVQAVSHTHIMRRTIVQLEVQAYRVQSEIDRL